MREVDLDEFAKAFPFIEEKTRSLVSDLEADHKFRYIIDEHPDSDPVAVLLTDIVDVVEKRADEQRDSPNKTYRHKIALRFDGGCDASQYLIRAFNWDGYQVPDRNDLGRTRAFYGEKTSIRDLVFKDLVFKYVCEEQKKASQRPSDFTDDHRTRHQLLEFSL